MKKIAVMGSGNGSNFEAIAKYFEKKEVEIICISDIKDSYILERAKNLGIKHLFLPYEKTFDYLSENKFDLIVLAGYMRILSVEVLRLGKFVNVHPSLLPAFKGTDSIRRAFLSGVKVSGVTVHIVNEEVDSGKIIAQYPVLIDTLTHFDEFESEIHQTEHILYPVVIEKLLNDEVFDFSDLFGDSGGCGKNCGGCGGCH